MSAVNERSGVRDVTMTKTSSHGHELCVVCGLFTMLPHTGVRHGCACDDWEKRLYRIEVKQGWIMDKLGITKGDES
jgi:hypothetical protein